MDEIRDEERRGHDQTVDPVLRAHVQSLCTALGGPSNDGSGKYILGDEAQFVLRDLKKWLKGYDEKLNRLDVARCMAEANLVSGDLVEILASWPEDKTDVRALHRLMLSTMELLVPLTWPLDKSKDTLTVNQHRHSLYIRVAQAGYKRILLHHESGKVLQSCVRVALPSLAISLRDREPRDEGILKLLFYLIRNIALIKHPAPTDTDTGTDISPSATINAFHQQGILHLLLTAASGMGEEFKLQDVVVMETIYHLIKGVESEKLFLSDKEVVEKEKQGLEALLKQEKGLQIKADRNAPTRHNRFGTQIWVNRGNGKMSTVSGQDVLINREKGIEKMDKTKKWRRPNFGKIDPDDAEQVVHLDASARQTLKTFVEDVLDAGFNPLFMHIRRAIDHDEDRFLQVHIKQYFHLVAWFLEAERMRRRVALENNKEEVADSFALVAGVLNQEALIVLNRYLREWYDLKQWGELQAAMRCLTQILLTVQDMSLSPLEEDQDIAENIQNRLFYEEVTLELILNIVKSYTRQSLGYLDTCVEMAGVYLKMLERYAKQNTHMFIRSKRARKSKKGKDKDAQANGGRGDEGSAAEEERQNKAAVREKEFSFTQFESKFLTQDVINVHLALLKYYNELSYSQIKRIIAFFHRVFVKRGMEVIMFRLDILELLYRIAQGSDGLPTTHPGFKEIDQFARFYIKKLVKKLQEMPAMYTELLFTKDSSTYHYLQYGVDKEPKKARVARPPVEWEVKKSVAEADRVPLVVAALKEDDKSDAVNWLKAELQKCLDERKAWDTEMEARRLLDAAENGEDGENSNPKPTEHPPDYEIRPDTDDRKNACNRDVTVRLLLSLSGAVTTLENTWMIPGDLSTEDLKKKLFFLEKAVTNPIMLPEGQKPADLLRRKPASRRFMETDSEGSDDSDLDGFLERNGDGSGAEREYNEDGTEKERRKKKKKSKQPRGAREPVDEEEAMRRKEAKRRKDEEKKSQIKSSAYIQDSDDEMDEEARRRFFEREKEIREIMSKMSAMPQGEGAKMGGTKKRKERKEGAVPRTKKRRVTRAMEVGDGNGESIPPIEIDSTPFSEKDPESDIDMRDSDEEPLSTPSESEDEEVTAPARIRVQQASDDEEGSGTERGSSPAEESLKPSSFTAAIHSDAANDDDENDIPIRGPASKRRARITDDDDDE